MNYKIAVLAGDGRVTVDQARKHEVEVAVRHRIRQRHDAGERGEADRRPQPVDRLLAPAAKTDHDAPAEQPEHRDRYQQPGIQERDHRRSRYQEPDVPDQLAGLLCKVDQDGAGLEHHEVVIVVIHDHRNSAIRIHGQEFRGFLLPLGEVDGMDRVIHADLLQHDGDLVAVGGGCGVELYHPGSLEVHEIGHVEYPAFLFLPAADTPA